MFDSASINLLKSLYNTFQQNIATWQNIATQSNNNQLQITIALAKVEAYQDCANSVFNMIQQG
jgi:autotransporter adhesin